MKKFFSLICAVVIALGASAAPLKAKKAVNKPAFAKIEKVAKTPLALKKVSDLKALATGDLVKKPAKAPKAAQAATIDIAVSNTTATGAQVAITPSDEEAYYVYDFAPASKLQGLTDAQIANDLINSYKEYIIEEMGEEYIDYLLPYLFYDGAFEDEFQGLAANTEYVVFAFYVDEDGNLQGSVAKKSFKTLEVTTSKKESISMTDGTVYVYDFGAWQFLGEDANYVVSVTSYSDEVAGTYKGIDVNPTYSYIGKVAGTDTTWYVRVDADLAVAVNGQNAVLSGKFIGQNEDDDDDIIEFELNLIGAIQDVVEGDEYDAEDEDYILDFAKYTVDDQYVAKYNVLVVEAEDEASNYISIDFNVAAGTTKLPVGEYPIDGSYAAGTVSIGEIDEGIYGSFAGSRDAEGYINVPMWLFNDGTVTVNANGTIDVAATNTWGRAITCHLGEASEGIENIKLSEKAQKIMVDGQMYIILDNKLFNLQGAQVR